MQWTDVSREGIIRLALYAGQNLDANADMEELQHRGMAIWSELSVDRQQKILSLEAERLRLVAAVAAMEAYDRRLSFLEQSVSVEPDLEHPEDIKLVPKSFTDCVPLTSEERACILSEYHKIPSTKLPLVANLEGLEACREENPALFDFIHKDLAEWQKNMWPVYRLVANANRLLRLQAKEDLGECLEDIITMLDSAMGALVQTMGKPLNKKVGGRLFYREKKTASIAEAMDLQGLVEARRLENQLASLGLGSAKKRDGKTRGKARKNSRDNPSGKDKSDGSGKPDGGKGGKNKPSARKRKEEAASGAPSPAEQGQGN